MTLDIARYNRHEVTSVNDIRFITDCISKLVYSLGRINFYSVTSLSELGSFYIIKNKNHNLGLIKISRFGFSYELWIKFTDTKYFQYFEDVIAKLENELVVTPLVIIDNGFNRDVRKMLLEAGFLYDSTVGAFCRFKTSNFKNAMRKSGGLTC